MAFGDLFDGYCMIHAEHATSERRPWFEKELHRVGVDHYTVINAPQIANDEPRVVRFTKLESERKKRSRSVAARISLADARIACLNFARANKWRNVVIMEDDVVFRQEFTEWWAEVESSVAEFNWDILFLYRSGIIEPEEKTHLIRIPGTIRTHCYIVREQHYEVYERAIRNAIWIGRSVDTKYTYKFLKQNCKCKISATSRNLAGQSAEFRSSISAATRKDTMRKVFGFEKG